MPTAAGRADQASRPPPLNARHQITNITNITNIHEGAYPTLQALQQDVARNT